MKSKLSILLLILLCNQINAKDINVKIRNRSGQLITQLDYWLGSISESSAANLQYLSKGNLQNAADISLPLDFQKTKRNTLLIRAYLVGGGYISQKYNISPGEEPVIDIINAAIPIKTQEFDDVMKKFSALKITGKSNQASVENALDALIGSIFIYSDSINVVYKILPNTLKTRSKKIDVPDLNRKISGIFSSETSVKGNLSLPFVSASTTFESGDVAKFTWEIEDVGEFNWASEEGKDLAVLFSQLPDETKTALIDLYDKYPNAKMKFIDKAFVIGRLEVLTSKTKKISSVNEINGANYVTASGNYQFFDGNEDKFVLKNVVTQIEGYDATILLTSMYLNHKKNKLTTAENNKVQAQYLLLRDVYPGLEQTNDIGVMQTAISKFLANRNANGDPNSVLAKQTISIKPLVNQSF